LGKTKGEALELLQRGELDFVRFAEPSRIKELETLAPEAPFYIGLRLLKQGDRERAIAALLSLKAPLCLGRRDEVPDPDPLAHRNQSDRNSPWAAHTTGRESAVQHSRLVSRAPYGSLVLRWPVPRIVELQKFIDSALLSPGERGWGLFSRLALDPGNQKVLDDIETYFLTGTTTELHRNLFEQIQEAPDIFLPQSLTDAVTGRIFILDRSYGDALYYFKEALYRNRYLFEAYPDLLTDLGKAYQYSGDAEAGIKLFTDWEATIVSGENTRALVTNSDRNEIRFRLLFFPDGWPDRSRHNRMP